MAHGLLVIAALVALLCVPCLLALALFADVALDRAGPSLASLAARWRDRRAAARLERSAGLGRAVRPRLRRHPEPADVPAGPPFEQVAADLRRLARQRAQVAPRSQVWFAAVHRAYDNRLQIACRELEILEHLHELDGIDLEIERLRVEGLLQAAGLTLAVVDSDGSPESP